MKNCLLVLLVGLMCACTSSNKSNDIVVTFDVKNPTATEVVLVYHMTVNEVPLDGVKGELFGLQNGNIIKNK